MRQGQQNRRGRGRSGGGGSGANVNGNRKGQNPLSRTYESNGPDVKIRGTAAQIAEKYMTLSRDASSAGDTVMAENYLQHAEHYNRIIMAAQALNAQNAMPNGAEAGHGANGSHRPQRETNPNMRDQQPQPHGYAPPGYEPQPFIEEASAKTEQPPRMTDKSEKPSGTDVAPEAAADGKGQKGADTDQSEQPRRRRRRYPSANGNGSAHASDTDGTGQDDSQQATAPSEKQSSDEAAA